MKKLLTPFSKGKLLLKNHLVMAPMTRGRAVGNIPNALMKAYYTQRTGAGLIITEGTAPTPDGLGYPRIPGIYSQDQIEGWREITKAVHENGSKIFVQLMHTGRISHADNLSQGNVVGASSIKADGKIYTDTNGMQEYSQPKELSTTAVEALIKQHGTAAANAIEAGFDGIELHGANGYLIEQFLNPNVNNRPDRFGGSVENRSRFLIELAGEVANAIGAERVGVRLSPMSTLGDLKPYDASELHETYAHIAKELNAIGIAYIHIGIAGPVPAELLRDIRQSFKGTIILCNGLTPESGEAALHENFADLVAFGRAFLANPDLDARIASDAPLNEPDHTTFYAPGATGYTDYPTLESKLVSII